ncbi:AAA family ATPase [Psychrilyobacter piezotolerans]|uniref:AAA family ATPase n=1 Tax=Psychrilyobacter piezotolerans TaxID=2293438 RepID=UPI0021019D2F|nr:MULTISPECIES: AAA family ATPase [Psychrilyobacter]MCS5421836.1 ATP-binding protein [Psychrilyobacter sp. S5]
MKFRWPVKLSSGELKLFRFMGRLSDLTNTIDLDGNWDNILLLIDELDTSFHPEWKRRVIKFLNNFFSKIYLKNNIQKTTNKKIQIIITSHSPFIASDLPKNNILCLKLGKTVEKNKINTFGANIFDLYKETFFVDSTFGEFATEKIKKAVSLLTPTIDKDKKNKLYHISEDDEKKIRYIIDSIGEKLIKNKLERMWEDYLNNEKEKNNDIIKRLMNQYDLSNKDLKKFLEGENQ